MKKNVKIDTLIDGVGDGIPEITIDGVKVGVTSYTHAYRTSTDTSPSTNIISLTYLYPGDESGYHYMTYDIVSGWVMIDGVKLES